MEYIISSSLNSCFFLVIFLSKKKGEDDGMEHVRTFTLAAKNIQKAQICRQKPMAKARPDEKS